MKINPINLYNANSRQKFVSNNKVWHSSINQGLQCDTVSFKGVKEAAVFGVLGGLAGGVVTILTAGAAAPIALEMAMIGTLVGMADDSDDKNNSSGMV